MEIDSSDKHNNEERIKWVDERYYTPNERTKKVWNTIIPLLAEKKFGEWDMLTFCVGYLTKVCASVPHLEKSVLQLAKDAYITHYACIDQMLPPDRIQKDGTIIPIIQIVK